MSYESMRVIGPATPPAPDTRLGDAARWHGTLKYGALDVPDLDHVFPTQLCTVTERLPHTGNAELLAAFTTSAPTASVAISAAMPPAAITIFFERIAALSSARSARSLVSSAAGRTDSMSALSLELSMAVAERQ
jgi:hypothetical protein